MVRCDRHTESCAWRLPRVTRPTRRSIGARCSAAVQRPGLRRVATPKSLFFLILPGFTRRFQAHTMRRGGLHTFGRETDLTGVGSCILWGESDLEKRTSLDWRGLTVTGARRRGQGVTTPCIAALQRHPILACAPAKHISLEQFTGYSRFHEAHNFGREDCILWGEEWPRRLSVCFDTYLQNIPPAFASDPSLPLVPRSAPAREDAAQYGERTPLSLLNAKLIQLQSASSVPHSRSEGPARAIEHAPIRRCFVKALTYGRGFAYLRARRCTPTGETVHTYRRGTAYFRERNSSSTVG